MCTAVARHVESPAEELRAILNRSKKYVRENPGTCGCRVCTERRATTIHCEACGYVGAPYVAPCDCGDKPGGWLEEELDAMERAAKAGRLADGSPLSREKRASWRRIVRGYRQRDRFGCPADASLCAHGSVECPVCEVDENTNEYDRQGWAIIRDLRALLADRGLL